MEITSEQRDQWRADAEAHAAETRHPSGYYPSARILALLDALEAAEQELARVKEEADWEAHELMERLED